MVDLTTNLNTKIIKLDEGAKAHVPQNENNMKMALGAFIYIVTDVLDTEPVLAQPADDGKQYIVLPSATGTNWAGNDNSIAQFRNDEWVFIPGIEGMHAYDQSTKGMFHFNGTNWIVGYIDKETTHGVASQFAMNDVNGLNTVVVTLTGGGVDLPDATLNDGRIVRVVKGYVGGAAVSVGLITGTDTQNGPTTVATDFTSGLFRCRASDTSWTRIQ